MARDYVLRLIEQIAAALAGVVSRKKVGDHAAAAAESDRICVQTIGLSLARLKGLSPEAVAKLLQETGGLRTVRAVTLAELLLLDPDGSAEAREPSPAGAAEVHAFCLLTDSMAAFGPEEQAVYRPKLDQLADRLGHFRTHPYLRDRLRDYGTIAGD